MSIRLHDHRIRLTSVDGGATGEGFNLSIEIQMFSFCTSGHRIGVYLDYSNMHYTKYTLGWDYNISGFIDQCTKNSTITKIALYGAYDPKNIPQYNRTRKLINQYKTAKNYFYFKKLEHKGGTSKGNVDTEMGYDIAMDQGLRDCLVLFTGDGDFLYPIQQLIKQGKSIIIISTKGHIAKELIDFISTQDDTICRYVDIHKENTITTTLRSYLKDTSRGVCIAPELYQWIQHADHEQIVLLQQRVQAALHGSEHESAIPSILQTPQKTTKRNIKSTILHRHPEQKQGLIDYLNAIIS